MSWWLVLPSLRVSGGVKEALRLGDELNSNGDRASVLTLWRSQTELDSKLAVRRLSEWRSKASRALFQLPLLFLRFRRWLASTEVRGTSVRSRFIFTHYTTLPLSLLLPRSRKYFFVQDLEWKFVRHRGMSQLLRQIILRCYRSGEVIAANSYLSSGLRESNITVAAELPIWADREFGVQSAVGAGKVRDIDFVMVLRKGVYKRPDLYETFIALTRGTPKLKVAAISIDQHLLDGVRDSLVISLCRPSTEQMRALYARSLCFLHFSDHEGFGLPPLEAMGAGCIPLCRDSGGVRAFMQHPDLRELLLPLDVDITRIHAEALRLVADSSRCEYLARVAREVFASGLQRVQQQRADSIRALIA